MVCCYADIVHVYKHLPSIDSYLDCVTCHFLVYFNQLHVDIKMVHSSDRIK